MRIMVATDGSNGAADAIEWPAHFPLPPDATVEVVSAIPGPIFDENVLPTPWSLDFNSWIDNSTNPPTFWYGDQMGYIVRVQPME